MENWKEGYALDLHTSSSFPMKDAEGNNITDSRGNIKWDKKRSPIAEELYKLKYWKEKHHVGAIAVCAGDFLTKYKAKWQLDVIIPIPPSDMTRDFQPVYEISQLKEIEDPDCLTSQRILTYRRRFISALSK